MSQKYFTTLTHIGAALHANAQLQQTTVPWTHLVLGDGNGAEPVPSPAQTGVIREVDRLAISSIETDPNNPNWIVIEAVIPADRGGYVVRETALMGTAGGNQCIAVGNYPSATKPLLSEGAGSELVIRVVVEIAHTATVTLKIDPAVVIASRDWVEKLEATQEQAQQGLITGRWLSPARALQLMRASVAQATELIRGTLRIGTQAEVNTGALDDVVVTPKKLLFGILALWDVTGYIVLPKFLRGLSIQWGRLSVNTTAAVQMQTVTFPVENTGTTFAVFCEAPDVGNSGVGTRTKVQTRPNQGFNFAYAAPTSITGVTISWVAIGRVL